jgi:hypothetical protein
VISTDEQGDPVYEDVGPTPRFMELARRHRRALETEAPPTARKPILRAAKPKRKAR